MPHCDKQASRQETPCFVEKGKNQSLGDFDRSTGGDNDDFSQTGRHAPCPVSSPSDQKSATKPRLKIAASFPRIESAESKGGF
jgi:hypothetical protein